MNIAEAQKSPPAEKEPPMPYKKSPLGAIAYYKLRLTLTDEIPTEETLKRMYSPKRLANRARPYVEKLIEKHAINPMKYSAVVEILDKRGNYTKPHLHLHFESYSKHDTVVKMLKREYEKITEEVLKGNQLYSLVLETFIDDDRFYRYPLKQLESLDNPLNLTPKTAHENQEVLRQVANAQWKIGCEVANTKNARHEPSEDRYKRMSKFIEKKSKPTNLTQIALGITQFYQKENSAINPLTIKGYTITYALQNKILSEEIFAKTIADDIRKYQYTK